jgi:sodium/hydrogen exchanger-like protein 6/7
MKHYAYHNMSRRTQLTTKFVFQVMAQLSENFIFIYLGLSLFTETTLVFKPLFILITVVGICVARWAAVFPLSRAINWFIRYRARRNGLATAEEIPYSHQAMLFWAGLRGAVGVALAAGMTGPNGPVLRATVLVVVVLTVIIFGGTTARMLEILNIRTGVVEEIDSDDEFDIEYISSTANGHGTYAKTSGQGFGHHPRPSQAGNGFALGSLEAEDEGLRDRNGTYSSGNRSPNKGPYAPARRNSSRASARNQDAAEQGLLSPADSLSISDDDDGLDLPPAARRMPSIQNTTTYPTSGHREPAAPGAAGIAAGVLQRVRHAPGAVSQLISELSEDPANSFRLIDENFIKPHLLLDPGSSPSPGPGRGGGGHGEGHS